MPDPTQAQPQAQQPPLTSADLSAAGLQQPQSPGANWFSAAMQEEQKAQAIREQAVRDMKATQGEQGKVLGEIEKVQAPTPSFTPPPAAPKLPPPQLTKAFSSPLVWLALLAGALTRQPLMGMMTAFSGVVQGAQAGNQEEQKRALAQYQAQKEQWQAQFNKEKEEYQAALNKTHLSVDERMAELNMLTAKNRDEAAQAELLSKGPEGIEKLQMKRGELAEQLVIAEEKMRHQTALFGGAGNSDNLDMQAEMIIRGVPIGSAVPGFGNAGVTARMAAQERAKQILMAQHPSMTAEQAGDYIAQAGLQYKSQQASETAAGHIRGGTEQGAQEIQAFAPLVEQAATAVNTTKYPTINSIELAVKRHTGDPTVIQLNSYIQAAKNAYAQVMSRGGRITDASRERADELLAPNMSIGQISAGIQAMATEAGVALSAGTRATAVLSGGATQYTPPLPPGMNTETGSFPAAAVEDLKAGRGTPEQFDAVFGQGAAARALGGHQ